MIAISNLLFFAFFFHFFPLPFCPCIPADALESLRQSCESVCPNDGFLEQVILALQYQSVVYTLTLGFKVLKAVISL